MDKPVVFISHITEEKEMAMELKKLIEESFLGMLDVFVSSDENSISSGSKWLDNITNALSSCAIELILCSPNSVKRPWINFEAGAGWVRDIPVIPLCHSGMKPSKLPVPINSLQAAEITEAASLRLIFPVLASAIGCKCPKVDFTEFTDKMKEFEENYSFWDSAIDKLHKIEENCPGILKKLKGGTARVTVPERELNNFLDLFEFFEKRGYLKVEKDGNVFMTTDGMMLGVEIHPKDRCYAMLAKAKSKM